MTRLLPPGPRGTDRRGLRALAAAALLLPTACRGEPPPGPAPSSTPSSAPPPVDHLAPGELPEGKESVFGLKLPEGLVIAGLFEGEAHAFGKYSQEDVSNYVRERVDVKRVELGAVGTIFPQVHIRGGDPGRLYRIEVSPGVQSTKLVIKDVTPRAPSVPGLTDAERWRRAGYHPDGTPLNPDALR